MRASILTFVVVFHTAVPAFAQSSADAPAPKAQSSFRSLFTELGHDFAKLPSKRNVFTLAIGGALAAAVYPADRDLTMHARQSDPLEDTLEAGGVTGSGWFQFGAAFGTYIVGRATTNETIRAVGADLVQAQIMNAALTQSIKLVVNRERPDEGRYSFPSGHSSGTFATATVLQRHFGWKVGLPAYGIATYVAASRLQENRHYASDVIFGAAIGVVAGRSVTVGRGAATFDVSPVVVPGGGAVNFTLSQRR